MTRQEFVTKDIVRLEVQGDWPDLPNIIENPSGSGGAWGWQAYFTGGNTVTTKGSLAAASSPTRLRLTTPAKSGGLTYQGTARTIVAPPAGSGRQLRGSIEVLGGYLSSAQLQVFSYPDLDGTGTPTLLATVPLTTTGVKAIPITNIPDDALSLWSFVTSYGNGNFLDFRDLVLMVGSPAEIAASDPLTEPDWVNIIGSTNKIDTERDELNAGFLNATIFDSALDPASTGLIRPGKRCRLQVLVDGVWEPLFTGLLDNPSTAYVVKDPRLPEVKRARIQLVANDPAANLASSPRPNGVGTIADLPAVLLGCGVPWNLNGSTAAIDPATATVVAVNDSASALDQVAITRDSVLGYAWIDRTGTTQVWDAAHLGTDVADTLDETVYSDVDPDFEVTRLINEVVVNLSRINPGTGETEEIAFGPYQAPDSIREWRRRRAEFRVQGVNEATIPDFAAAVFATNATPAKRINEVTVPLRTVSEVEAHALRDLYDLIDLSNDRAGIANQLSRVTTVKHSIVANNNGGKWLMTLSFATEGTVAVPQVTPPPGATGKTLAQLLRPVGEVTQWFGDKADCPAGWLVLDGSAFDGSQYPELAALLGGTTLPNATDRFPIGAGTKGLGTTGGSPSVVIGANNLPPHSHNVNVGNAAGTAQRAVQGNTTGGTVPTTTGGFANDPLDVLNPWLALWYIIRAA